MSNQVKSYTVPAQPYSGHKKKFFTDKSMSEALIFALTNPQ